MVSLDFLADGLAAHGRVAIYDIYFDTGKSEVKAESSEALRIIAEYLNQHRDKQFLVVGHTDNVGAFDMNIRLSTDRANAVVEKLVAEYGIRKEQLKAHGVGPAAPVSSNATDEGRAKNRRVEIVER